ncbi:hypothetical protein GCM10017044_26050 [Kordiimonas sediminis]|uniref:Flagellar protein FlaG n=1 Tax=Kordiimonas sediminis TaxID=1735581 RepID=A0A919AXH2_9PROT|nr:flagellar protein FlaG [Kordiimonas sediminis]GHF29567.1 hypothetical protein GCM10017044_26050 [Kordiimonas sediminis]
MADIGNTVGGAQVVNLKATSNKQQPQGVERFSPPERQGPIAQAQSVQAEITARNDEAAKNRDPLEAAAEKIQEFIPEGRIAPNTRLRIDQDDSGMFVYQSVDKDSGEVLNQFPSKEILEFLAYYRDAEGIVVDDEV